MSRTKVGLALGSGGARGLAHIGILSELIESNIPIDYVAGVSIGSVVGAYYAVNLEIKSFEEKILQLTKRDWFKLADLTSPKRALIAGNKIKDFMRDLIEDKSFSDTKIPLKVVATDLCSGKEVRINKGKLVDAIRASISIPGIFRPVKLNEKLLVDGGVVNPTPVDVVKGMGADVVIGVDLTMKHPVKLGNPNIVQTLMQSFEILRTQAVKNNVRKFNNNSLIVNPNLLGVIQSYKFYEASQFIEEGKKATKKALPKIRALIEKAGR